MKKTIGIVLIVLGVLGALGALGAIAQNTEQINFFGKQLTISNANWAPFFVSLFLLIGGLVMLVMAKK